LALRRSLDKSKVARVGTGLKASRRMAIWLTTGGKGHCTIVQILQEIRSFLNCTSEMDFYADIGRADAAR